MEMRTSSVCGDFDLRGRAWKQRVGAFVALPLLIRHLGGDPGLVLRTAGLSEDSFKDPENRIPYAAFVGLLGKAAEHMQCSHFGLLAGRMLHLSGLGVFGQVVRHSETVGRALDALTVYQHIDSEGGLSFLLKRGEFVELGYAVHQPGTRGAAHMIDAAIAGCMNIMTELCGPSWKPYQVLLSRARHYDETQYRATFKAIPRFDAEYSALRFPASDLARPIFDADPAIRLRAEQSVLRAGSPDFLQQVYRSLRRLMLENRHSGDDLAAMLALHRRTLNRRLRAEGTTFQNVLDDVRFGVARDLLENTNVQLDDVAAALGYASIAPFMRTFRRWTGTTPGQWRRKRR